jgi:tellurite resistance protein TerC
MEGSDGGMGFWPWAGFIAFVIVMLGLDLGLGQGTRRAVNFKKAIGWSIVWIGMACLFALVLHYTQGPSKTGASEPDKAILFVTGYLVEWSLSVDNLFVFLLIFRYFKVGHREQQRVLFWGIVGAIVLRALFIAAGSILIEKFAWITYVFGVFLVYTAIKLAFRKDEGMDPGRSLVFRLANRFLPIAHEDHPHGHFFVRQGGRLLVTPLFVVLPIIATTDVLFAVDSIPAIFAITHDTFVIVTSNTFAVLGLRSLFVVLAGFMTLFRFLNYGLVVILGFVGVKMLLADYKPIAPHWSLAIILATLLVSVLLSLLIPEREKEETEK